MYAQKFELVTAASSGTVDRVLMCEANIHGIESCISLRKFSKLWWATWDWVKKLFPYYIRQSTSATMCEQSPANMVWCTGFLIYIDSLGQFNYGLAHASSNHVILKFVKKMGESYGNYKSSCKQSNSCFKAIAWFYKVCNLKNKISLWYNASEHLGWQWSMYPAAVVHRTFVIISSLQQ